MNRSCRKYDSTWVRDAAETYAFQSTAEHGDVAESHLSETSSVVSVADWTVSLSQLRRLLIAHEDRLACKAFDAVFQQRQTQHRVLLAWLGKSLAGSRPFCSADRCILVNAITWRARGSGDGAGDGVDGLEAEAPVEALEALKVTEKMR